MVETLSAMRKVRAFPVGLTLLLLLPALSLAGSMYSITDLGLLPGGGSSAASGISSNGWVVGYGDSTTAFSQPFLWTPGAGLTPSDVNSVFAFGAGVNVAGVIVGYGFDSAASTYRAFASNGTTVTLIPILAGGAYNLAAGINDSGLIVGYSDTLVGGTQGFSYSYSTSVLTALAGTNGRANAVNNAGMIAGQADLDGVTHAVVWTDGSSTALAIPSSYQSAYATAVSNDGRVAGALNDDFGGAVAFLWQGGSMSTLGALTPGGSSLAYGVNSAGLVVGTSDGSAFLFDGTTMTDLNGLLVGAPSVWQLTEADAINDAGQIVGTGFLNGGQHAFLLTPEQAPEPASLVLISTGLLLAISRRRRRRKT